MTGYLPRKVGHRGGISGRIP